MFGRRPLVSALGVLLLLVAGCDGGSGADTDGGTDPEETELITTVTLTFSAPGADPITASFDDPDGDGGASGTSEPITLAANTAYTLQIEFFNGHQTPPDPIHEEVAAEAEEHQVLVYGSSVTGPSSQGDGLLVHAFADVESDYGANAVGEDLPVGLQNTLDTSAAGTGELRVMLRHLPELNGTPQKTADLPMLFGQGEAVAGDVDADVRFDITVQ